MSSYSARGDDDDDFVHVRSPSHAGRRGRDYSPDYHSGGYMAGGNPSVASPFEEHTPFYAPATRNLNPNPNNSLQVPSSASRPRSTPPYSRSQGRDRRDRDRDDDYREKPSRSRGRDKYRSRQNSDDESDRSRPRSPLGKAKHIAKSTFSDSTSGLGVGVLGAIIGGMAAREASEAAARRGPGSRHGSKDHQGAELLSTIVGAAVGGLGANALEKRLEKSRGKTKEDQEKWERKYGKDERDRDRRDGTGYGIHGDYLFGWKGDALQRAMDNKCAGDNCKPLQRQADAKAIACTKGQMAHEDIGDDKWLDSLPGQGSMPM